MEEKVFKHPTMQFRKLSEDVSRFNTNSSKIHRPCISSLQKSIIELEKSEIQQEKDKIECQKKELNLQKSNLIQTKQTLKAQERLFPFNKFTLKYLRKGLTKTERSLESLENSLTKKEAALEMKDKILDILESDQSEVGSENVANKYSRVRSFVDNYLNHTMNKDKSEIENESDLNHLKTVNSKEQSFHEAYNQFKNNRNLKTQNSNSISGARERENKFENSSYLKDFHGSKYFLGTFGSSRKNDKLFGSNSRSHSKSRLETELESHKGWFRDFNTKVI